MIPSFNSFFCSSGLIFLLTIGDTVGLDSLVEIRRNPKEVIGISLVSRELREPQGLVTKSVVCFNQL